MKKLIILFIPFFSGCYSSQSVFTPPKVTFNVPSPSPATAKEASVGPDCKKSVLFGLAEAPLDEGYIWFSGDCEFAFQTQDGCDPKGKFFDKNLGENEGFATLEVETWDHSIPLCDNRMVRNMDIKYLKSNGAMNLWRKK